MVPIMTHLTGGLPRALELLLQLIRGKSIGSGQDRREDNLMPLHPLKDASSLRKTCIKNNDRASSQS